MPATVTTSKKQGSIMGTVIAAVRDDIGEVEAVDFYVTVLDTAPVRRGPYPADILRRPAPGVYEKDVVLDTVYETKVETELQQVNGTKVIGTPQTFTARSLSAGGGLQVQDQDTAAATAVKLVFEGPVVQVDAAGVATLSLDSRYALQAHTHAYLPLAGGTLTSSLNVNGNVSARISYSDSSGGNAFTIGEATSGIKRFSFGLLNTENGSNTGGNLTLWRYSDTGSFLNSVFSVRRNTGIVTFASTPMVGSTALALASQLSAYLPLAGGTMTGALAVTGAVSATSVKATGNHFIGSDDAYLHLSNTAAQFLTSSSQALQGRFGSLLLSDSYLDAGSVPAQGLYTKGGARLGPYIDVGVGLYNATIRRPDGGHLHLQAGVTGSVVIGDPTPVTYKLHVGGSVGAAGEIVSGSAVIAGVASASTHYGSAIMHNSNLWSGGAAIPTIAGTGDPFSRGIANSGLIMLIAPHLPYVPGYGSTVRHTTSYPHDTAYWDSGCFGADAWGVRRNDGSAFLSVGNTGTLSVSGAISAGGNLTAGNGSGGYVFANWLQITNTGGGLYAPAGGAARYLYAPNASSYWNVVGSPDPGFHFRNEYAGASFGYVIGTAAGPALYGPSGALQSILVTDTGVKLSGSVTDSVGATIPSLVLMDRQPNSGDTGYRAGTIWVQV